MNTIEESIEASNDTPSNQYALTEVQVEIESVSNPITPEGTSSQKVKKRSKVWEHYTKITNATNRVKCKYCPKDYAYNSDHGTTTLWKHLRAQCIESPLFNEGFLSERQQNTLDFKEVDDVKVGSKKRDLVTHLFDNEKCRKSLTSMIIKDELPFNIVEGEGFRRFCAENLPQFIIPTRWTIVRDCWKLYIDERARLRKMFQYDIKRVSLTIDAWTSIQEMSYICLTAYFIDNNWGYQKRLINFCLIADHRGDTISRTIETCLMEWGIERVFTITLDNVIANDVIMSSIEKRLKNWKVQLDRGNCLQVRSVAHILNSIVNEGFETMHSSILSIRNAIRYVRSSPLRLSKFKEFVEKEKLCATSLVSLDVTTRWNSTYKMLESACRLQKAFERMEEDDGHYKIFFIEDDNEGPPTKSDWENAKVFVDVLRIFYDVAVRFSGTLYVTSCDFFLDLEMMNDSIQKLCLCDDSVLRNMGFKMKTKFDEYWGDPKKINPYLLVATILDPRMKMPFLSWSFERLYGVDIANEMLSSVKTFLESLFDEYRAVEGGIENDSKEYVNVTRQSSIGTSKIIESYRTHRWQKFLRAMASKSNEVPKTEVERYLSEEIISDYSNSFDVLAWWELNSSRFKILSRIARYILAIPVSTVASESTFNMKDRVLDQFRSSLNPKITEALLCAQDWFRSTYPHLELDCDEFVNEASEWFEMEIDG